MTDPITKESAQAPVVRSVDVPLPPAEAFRLFTEDLGRWWPLQSHSVAAGSGSQPERVTVEPYEGGAVAETLPGGGASPWATVRGWEPGRRLALEWYPGRPQDEATDVEVVFSPIGNGTRVTVTHTGFERLGMGATASAQRYREGWAHVLVTCFAAHCKARTAAPQAQTA